MDDDILTYCPNSSLQSLLSFYQKHQNEIESALQNKGGVLFRGFNIHAVSEFNNLAKCVAPTLMEYVYRSTPRTKLGGNIYTATEYPPARTIPLHNEFSYALKWPAKIMFFCVIAPSDGGETPVADSRKVLSYIDKDILDKFKSKKVMYVRNYTSGIDLSWQEVFQTSIKEEVNSFCAENGIEVQWRDGSPELTTRQICQATTIHPVTKEEVWFNQAHLFHISSLPKSDRQAILNELGYENLTRNAFYGDGTEIEEESLDSIKKAYEKAQIKFKWQQSDVMLLDNVLMAHGRTPYSGDRKIVVAMGN